MRISNGFRRARAAIDRHGLPALAVIALRALFGLGLSKTLRLAVGDQPFLSAVSAPSKDAASTDRLWPPQLDGQGTISAAAWARWLRQSRSSPPFAPPASTVAFVLDVSSGPADGLSCTRQAVQALGADLILIETSDWTPEHAAFYVFLEVGDVPSPDFLSGLGEAGADGSAQIITFDLFRRLGDRIAPILLPGANPTLLAARDYIVSRAVVKGSVMLGSKRQTPREAILAWCADRSVTEARAGWCHIGRPLLEVSNVDEKRRESMKPLGQRPPGRKGQRNAEPTSVVICTRDKGHLTRQLVRQLLSLGNDQVGEVVIVSNGTSNPYALQCLTDLAREPRVQVIRDDAPFNFSGLCNAGVRQTRQNGPLLFLNDDLAPVSEDWLASLNDHLWASGTGAVGPLLLYPNERVQHAGMNLRFPFGVGHVLRGAHLPQEDLLGFAAAAREVSCVTGAVLLTHRSTFERVGGFDEKLAISFQDVDYCLKIHQLGLRNIFEPKSVLIHMESVSLDKAGTDQGMLLQRYRERVLFMERWAPVFSADPFYPAGLAPDDESARRLTVGRP